MTKRAPLSASHPDVARRLVDACLADRYSAGSAMTVEWVCPEHPETTYRQEIRRIVAGLGCPYCSGHRVLAGFNDLATTHPDLANQLLDRSLGNTLSAGSNRKVTWVCDQGHQWEASVVNRSSGRRTGCPDCSGRRIQAQVNDLHTKHPDLAKELVDPDQAIGLAPRSHRQMRWRCPRPTCAHIYSASPANRTAKRPRGCPVCANKAIVPGRNDLATTHPELAKMLFDPADAQVVYGTAKRLRWRCEQHPGTPFWATPRSRARNGCGICNRKVLVSGVNDLATTHPDLIQQLVHPEVATTLTAGSSQRVLWRCVDHPEHTWTTFVYGRTGARDGTSCPICFSTQPSHAEEDLALKISQLVPDSQILRSRRDILSSRRELDIVVPEHDLAVEFNGVYWHSEEAGTRPGDHLDKTREAHAAGLHLVNVWEDDWRDRPDIVLRGIAYRLHASSRLIDVCPDLDPRAAERVFARRLHTDSAAGREVREFLQDNHIQGAVTCTRTFVLRDDTGSIRALLGLRSPRNSARSRRAQDQWEIQRYATLGSVVGGFTRLVKVAERTLRSEGVDLASWVSFSANDISDGGLYTAAGFTKDKDLRPEYTYVGRFTGERRVPKESFQRKRFRTDPDLLWDENWTEAHAARENGLRRIWDCGKTRWVKAVES